MSQPVQQSLQVVKAARAEVNKILTGTEGGLQLLELNNFFQRIETRLVFMGAVTEPDNVKAIKDDHPPITSFMGKKVEIRKGTSAQDIKLDDDEKKIFLAKVDKLWANIHSLGSESVLNAYTQPGDVLVLRGVAKRAGIEDFEKQELNISFVDQIKKGVAKKNEEKGKQSFIDKTLLEEKSRTVLTQEDIDADADIQKMKAEPGDTLIIRNDGKKILNKAKKEKPATTK